MKQMTHNQHINIQAVDIKQFLTTNTIPNSLKGQIEGNHGFYYLKNIQIEDSLNIDITNSQTKLTKSTTFVDCIFTDWVTFNFSQVETIIGFIRCSFEKSIIIHDGTFKYGLSFHDCVISQTIQINNGTFTSLDLEFKSPNAQGGIAIMRGFFNKLKIRNCFLDRVSINLEETKGNMLIDENKISHLDIDGNLSNESELLISNTDCKYFELSKFQNFGKLEVFRLKCNNTLSTRKIKEQKWIALSYKTQLFLKKYFTESSFTLRKCSFGSAVINNVDFSSFSRILIKDSDISQATFNNTKWFDKIEVLDLKRLSQENIERLQKGVIQDTKKDSYEKKEVYRQLKLASSKQNDTINEQYFHGLELRNYYKSISWLSKGFFTKAIIILSLVTSNFGQSVSRPIVCLLFGHLALFIVAILFNGYYPLQISFDNFSFNAFEEGFEKYFIYINPLRKTDLSLSGYLIVIDLMMRIWSSFMIYNIIRASRRFIK